MKTVLGALALLALAPAAASAQDAVPAAPGAPAAATAAAPAAPQVRVETLAEGKGDRPPAGSYVLVNYKGMLADGTVFDQAGPVPMPLDAVVPGFAQGIVQMQRGGRYRLTIPAALGYGERAVGPIPANSDLVFEIELIDFKTPDEMAALMRQYQAAQGAQEQSAPQAAAGAEPSGE